MTLKMVETHCHIIYGVDDGAKTFEDTQAMLRKAAGQGVEHILCTSHATPGMEPFDADKYLRHLNQAQAWSDAESLGLMLHSGCEILYTDNTPRLLHEGYIPTLANTWTVLVEFGIETPFDRMREACRALGTEGFTVMFAHIERFPALRSVKHIEELHDKYGAIMQMNSRTVYTKRGLLNDLWTRKVLDNGLIDVLGSDAHNDHSRPCHLKKAYDFICEHYDEQYAAELCGGNARRLLKL